MPLQGTWVQSPATWWITTIRNSSSRRSDTIFWPLKAPGMHTVHRRTCRPNPQTHKTKTEILTHGTGHTTVSLAQCESHCSPDPPRQRAGKGTTACPNGQVVSIGIVNTAPPLHQKPEVTRGSPPLFSCLASVLCLTRTVPLEWTACLECVLPF